METLVSSLHEYFKLSLTAVSLYDLPTEQFTKSKRVGKDGTVVPDDFDDESWDQMNAFIDHAFNACVDDLKQGKTIFLGPAEMKERLSSGNGEIPEPFQSVTLVPLVQSGNFKAALCMVSSATPRPPQEKD